MAEFDEPMTEAEEDGQPEADELDPASGVAEDTGTDTDAAEDAPPPPAASVDPYRELRTHYDREIAELKAALHNAAQAQRPPRSVIPRAFSIPQQQWTTQDLWEANQYNIQHELQRITAENEWRGKLSATTLGDGYDFDTVTKALYEMPEIADDPTSLHFVRNLDPLNRYMLALVHEVSRQAAGDPVRTIRAVRNAIGARLAAARDIQRAVTAPARQTNLNVIRGGRSHVVSRSKNPWDMSEEEFRREVNTRRG